MSLTIKSLNQLLDEPSDTQGETEYRRGAADIIGKLFVAVETLPPEIKRSDLEDSLWRWWHSLLCWQSQPGKLEPPAIEWRPG